MARFEIQVEIGDKKYFVDTYKEEPISLTYNVADIADIAARNSSFSKTIKVPETKNNRIIFSEISNLSVDSTFNPNKKSKAYILVDTVVVLDGYLQLRKAFVDKDTDKAEYELVIYADNDNFFKEVGDSYLSDLSFTELDHIWNKTSIESSWNYDWNKGYYYPLIDYGNNWDLPTLNSGTGIKSISLKPSFNVKYILNKIFKSVGYNYKSNFLDTKLFKNLYMPYTKPTVTRSDNGTRYRFTVGNTASQIATTPTQASTGGLGNINNYKIVVAPDTSNVQVQLASLDYGNTGLPIYVRFTDESYPNGDPDNLFTPVKDGGLSGFNMRGWYYTSPSSVPSQRFKCDFDITFRFKPNFSATKSYGVANRTATTISFRRSNDPITGYDVTSSGGYPIPVNGSTTPLAFNTTSIPGLVIDSTGKRVTGTIQTDMLNQTSGIYKKLQPNERVWVVVEYAANNKDIRATVGNSNMEAPIVSGQNTTLKWGESLLTFNPGTRIYNQLDTIVNPNELIEMGYLLPDKMKQKDFLVSIIRMFNLYIEPSKDEPKTLIIEPRDDYYKSGKIKNWTDKLDKNNIIEEQILGETQNRQTTFKYKDDTDYYNQDYKSVNGETYGQYDYFLDNDFISGKKTVEISFAPTPLVKLPKSTRFPIPVISKSTDKGFEPTDSQPRILTRYYSSTNSTWVYSDYQVRPTSSNIYLTTVGFTNVPHPNYQVGDYIDIVQSDGGALKPALTGRFRITEIYDTKTIGIDLPWWVVGSGPAVAGTCTPLDGLLPQYNSGDTWKMEGTTYKTIPYLGHLDNPYNPKYDLNYGQNKGTYEFLSDRITNDNLYRTYWSNYMNEISDKDSRIITASFYLTADDISDFRFNDNIFIENQYYKVNKIVNYNPVKDSLVKVELIKSKYITVPLVQSKTNPNNPWKPWVEGKPWVTRDVPWRWDIEPVGVWFSSIENVAWGTYDSAIFGRNNYVSGRNLGVFGNDNRISMARSVNVLGSNNIVEAGVSNMMLLGDNNIVTPNVKNTMVVGSNTIASESDTLVITSKIAISPNYIDASRNEILNPFPDSKVVNYLSGSRNAIRSLGSYDTVSFVSASRVSNTANSWSGMINNA